MQLREDGNELEKLREKQHCHEEQRQHCHEFGFFEVNELRKGNAMKSVSEGLGF